MKFLRIGIYMGLLLMMASAAWGPNQYYAVTGGSTADGPQLTVIDVNAQQVVGRLTVVQPIGGVAVTSDNSTVFATLSGTPDAPANSMVVIDITDPTAPALITQIDDLCGTEANANLPAAVALTADNAYAYAACFGSPLPGRPLGRWVAKVDTGALAVAGRIDMQQPGDASPGPFGIIAHPNGQEMWVTLYVIALVQRNNIVRINVADDTILGTITTGSGPTGGAFCPGQEFAYFSINSARQMARLTLDGTIVDTISLPVGTVGVAFTSDCATAFAGGYGNLAFQDRKLVRINTATRAVDAFDIGPSGSGPFNVAVSSDDAYLLVTMFGGLSSAGSTVKILDLASLDLLGEVSVGPAPSGIALTVPQ